MYPLITQNSSRVLTNLEEGHALCKDAALSGLIVRQPIDNGSHSKCS